MEVLPSRALSFVLPLMTLVAHATASLVVRMLYNGMWTGFFSAWCAVAAAASVAGFVGAVKKNGAMMSLYIYMYAASLSTATLLLFLNVFPFMLPEGSLMLSSLRFDRMLEKGMCYDSDDGFGWDASWVEQCRSSSRTLATGAVWFGLVLVLAQWWAMACVRSWKLRLETRNSKVEDDMKKKLEIS